MSRAGKDHRAQVEVLTWILWRYRAIESEITGLSPADTHRQALTGSLWQWGIQVVIPTWTRTAGVVAFGMIGASSRETSGVIVRHLQRLGESGLIGMRTYDGATYVQLTAKGRALAEQLACAA